MAHISDNNKSRLEIEEVDYDVDCMITYRLPKILRDFIMYEADMPFDAAGIQEALMYNSASTVLQMLRQVQHNERSKVYPGLDRPPPAVLLW